MEREKEKSRCISWNEVRISGGGILEALFVTILVPQNSRRHFDTFLISVHLTQLENFGFIFVISK